MFSTLQLKIVNWLVHFLSCSGSPCSGSSTFGYQTSTAAARCYLLLLALARRPSATFGSTVRARRRLIFGYGATICPCSSTTFDSRLWRYNLSVLLLRLVDLRLRLYIDERLVTSLAIVVDVVDLRYSAMVLRLDIGFVLHRLRHSSMAGRRLASTPQRRDSTYLCTGRT